MTARGAADWRSRARRLALLLSERGDVTDDAWRSAVGAVPRHRLVPEAYRQEAGTGAWQRIDTASDGGLDLVYSPTTLVTALDDSSGHLLASSSSTKPDLMLRMLHVLDVHEGHRVLEIGTGTGYNAALLAHRLGDDAVYSVDVDGELVDVARHRLSEIGFEPTLVAADGVEGLPEHAPFDRIISTCSVPSVPWSWAEQLTSDGKMLLDLKVGNAGGNLVALDRRPDRVEGRFTARWATFMTMWHGRDAPVPRAPRATCSTERSTTAPPRPWESHRVVWFLARFALPRHVGIGLRLDPDTLRPVAATLDSPDGSWVSVDLDGAGGIRRVVEAGPIRLWASVEDAHDRWVGFGEPDWPRFGVTAQPDRQWVWLDVPAGPNTWPLPPPSDL